MEQNEERSKNVKSRSVRPNNNMKESGPIRSTVLKCQMFFNILLSWFIIILLLMITVSYNPKDVPTITTAAAKNLRIKVTSTTTSTIQVTRTPRTLPSSTTQPACRYGPFSKSNGNIVCYFRLTDNITWDEASEECSSKNGMLPEIYSDEDNAIISNLVPSYYSYWDGLWLNVNGLSGKSNFVWNSTHASSTYTHWAPGSPDNQGNDENCLIMFSSGLWNDVPCDVTVVMAGAVCEILHSNSPTSGCKIGPMMKSNGDVVCYFRLADDLSWADASEQCHSQNARLPEIGSEADNNLVYSLMPPFNAQWDGLWLNLNDISGESDFKWNSSQDPPTYTNWAHGNPDNYNNSEHCVTMVIEGTWNDARCVGGLMTVATFCEEIQYQLTPTSEILDGPFGYWSATKVCPRDMFVTAFKTRNEQDQGSGDDTAMNGIEMSCSDQTTWLIFEGLWGDWMTKYNECPDGFTQAQIKLESENKEDHTAMNGIKLFCPTIQKWQEGMSNQWGNWTSPVKCPAKTKIVGIRAKLQPWMGPDEDDTALNGIEIFCA